MASIYKLKLKGTRIVDHVVFDEERFLLIVNPGESKYTVTN